jgi:hypothetical protein
MSLSVSGNYTSTCEVTNISKNGFWLLVNDQEYFISYSNYPEFLDMSINEIFNVTSIDLKQFHWSSKDIDVESLEKPESFSLIFKK